MSRKITCPRCDGDGQVLDSFNRSLIMTVVTFGFSRALVDECPTCDGKGWIYEDDDE